MPSGPTQAVDESVEEIGREETINQLKEEQENRSVIGRVGDFFTGAGAEREQQIERLEGNVEMNEGGLVHNYNEISSSKNFVKRYNEGGLVKHYNDQKSTQNFVHKYNQGGLINTYNNLTKIKNYKQGGFVSGPAGIDKVPAKLTAGEFVMSKGAVQKFGVNTLASMNASGGGTNVPTITQEFNQGGLVQYFENGGIARNMVKEPVGTPVINSTNKTITLPTIKKEGQDIIPSTVDDPLPTFRIPIVSSQRSMVLSSLGIQDLVGE